MSTEGIPIKESLEQDQGAKWKNDFPTRNFILPVITNMLVIITMFSLVHPYTVSRGWWAGVLEEVINVFNVDDLFPRPIVMARMLYWGWTGAWIYSSYLIYRRVATYDLSPSVFIYSANRFLFSFIVGSIVGMTLGTYTRVNGVAFDVNLATISVILFFIGFFPEQGLTWITNTAKKVLRQKGSNAKETLLSEIEGLSIWHQARLSQKNIDNVQNLAAADLPNLVASTAFSAGEVVDWVDQAILLRYTSNRQFKILEEVGIISASSFLLATSNKASYENLAALTAHVATTMGKADNKIDVNELKLLRQIISLATNIKIIMTFREKEIT